MINIGNSNKFTLTDNILNDSLNENDKLMIKYKLALMKIYLAAGNPIEIAREALGIKKEEKENDL
jgi:hypothetical protein